MKGINPLYIDTHDVKACYGYTNLAGEILSARLSDDAANSLSD
jgi:hypothetical protein